MSSSGTNYKHFIHLLVEKYRVPVLPRALGFCSDTITGIFRTLALPT